MRLKALGTMSVVLLVALPLCAQIDNGNLTGRVTDPAGAVIPKAQVTVTQTEMNFTTTFVTNDEGQYRAPNQRPGPYRIVVVATGFKRFVRDNVELRMNDTLEVNAQLEVGATTESVEVKAPVELLETETSSTGAIVEGNYFYDLPNFQRNIKASTYYEPGLTYTGLAYTGSLSGYHLNGSPTSAIGVFEDGALGTVGDGNSTDSIENNIDEMKVLTTSLPAEYGHSAGGAISVVKKSGTNEIHGIASEYGRTRRMQERKYFDMYRNSQLQPGWTHAPGLVSENPDGMLSGPVYLPHIYNGRNKTFFTFSVQRYIEKQSKQQVSTVPNAAELGGDFTFPDPNQGGKLIGQTIYDPTTTFKDASGNWHRTPFPGNVILPGQFSNLATKILGMQPYLPPNAPGTMTSTGPSSNEYTAPMKLVFFENYSVRLDHQISSSLKAYASWTYNSRFQRQPLWTVTENSFFDTSTDISHSGQPYQNTWGAGTTWVPAPTLVNDLRASYYRENQPAFSAIYNLNSAATLGLTGLSPLCEPNIWPGGFTESIIHSCPSGNLQELLTAKDDVSKVWGAHTFKFGYELLRWRTNSWSMGNPDGTFSYTGTNGVNTNGTSISNTGGTFANFLLGGISSVSFSRQLYSSLPRNWEHSFYAQDDWKLSPKLTLNLGVRYELETPPVQKYGLLSVFNPTAPDTSQYTNYTCNGCVGAFTHPKGAYPYDMQLNRFDPRVGLAWHVLGPVVIRAGFGNNHLDMRGNDLNTNELFSQATSISQAPGNPTPLFYTNQGVPAYAYPAARADGSIPYVGNAGSQGSVNIVEQHLRAPYNLTWNFGIETQLSRDYMLTLQYTGSAESQILGSYDLNTLPFGIIPNPNGGCTPLQLATAGYAACGTMNLNDPANATYRNTWVANPQPSRPWNNYGSILMQGNDGHSDHNEGTIRIEKRYSKGLNFSAFYTYGRTMQWSPGNQYLSASLFKTRAAFDQRHTFTGTMAYEVPVGKGRRFMNHGGIWNLIAGGYNFVWTFSAYSGQPAGMSISGSPYSSQQYPSFMPNYGNGILLKDPTLRGNWQDLGLNRFTQAAQNSMLTCGYDGSWVQNVGDSCMSVIPPYSIGNNNAELFDQQRIFAASASLSKEIPIKERLHLQLRLDFQNPFKWYNWGGITTSLAINSLANSKTFGTVASGNEGTTAAYGGAPLMNATIALKW